MARRRTLGRRLLWGVLGYVVTSLGALATTWLTSLDVSPLVGSLLATGVGLVLVVIGVLMDHAQDGEELPPRPSYPTPYPYPSPYQPPSRAPVPRRSIATVLVVILLLCGAGGFAVAYGAQWAGQRAIAFFEEQSKSPSERKLEDPGVERVGGTTSSTTGVLTLTVTSVRVNDQVTVLTVTASNQGADALTLPLFENALLTVPGAASLKADPSVGTWSQTVPAHGEATGTIVFDGVLGAAQMSVTLSFATIFGSLDGPRSFSMEIPILAAT